MITPPNDIPEDAGATTAEGWKAVAGLAAAEAARYRKALEKIAAGKGIEYLTRHEMVEIARQALG